MKRERTPDHIRDAIAEARRGGELIKSVAHRFGVSETTVVNVAKEYGITRKPKWQRIVDYAAAHPRATEDHIAEKFETTLHAVRVVLSKHGMSRGIFTLGREAHRAGLTVADIRALAAQRSTGA